MGVGGFYHTLIDEELGVGGKRGQGHLSVFTCRRVGLTGRQLVVAPPSVLMNARGLCEV